MPFPIPIFHDRKADSPVKQALADALQQRGYEKLTPVQEAVSKPELTGADMLVSAQTGSGKTVGFGLAIADALLGDTDRFGPAGAPLALVIAPTRELALQVKREFDWLFAKAGAVVTSTVGGMDSRDERRALARGAHIVVATPGRLRDHIMRKSIDLSTLRAVVLDEADEMLDLGFRDDLEFILGQSPEDRQTLMFSATVPRAIAALAKSYQTDAIRVETKADTSQHADIEYVAMNVAIRDAENAIINVLRYYESPNAIVFGNTRAMVNRMTTRLSNRGFSVVSLSGELTQTERTHALQAMRDGRARVCVATDVAARGIDLPNLDLVIHAELPNAHESLLHRSGRTGRAGRKGTSVLIIPPKSRRKAERLLQQAKVSATWSEAPSANAVSERDTDRMMADPAWEQEISESEAPNVAKLAEKFTAEQMAAAYLRLYQSRHSAPEELSASGAGEAPKPRAAFGPSVWFSLSGGRDAGAEPRRILPAVCKAGNLTKDDIGAIRIAPDQSYVEILASSVDAFIATIGSAMIVEDEKLVRLDRAPAIAKQARPAFSPNSKGGPRGGAGGGGNSRGDKPRYDKPRHEKPKSGKGDYGQRKFDAYDPDKPKSDAGYSTGNSGGNTGGKPTPGTTKKTDWNDASEPRQRKPKPASKTGGKPGGKPAGKSPFAKNRPEHSRPEGVVTPVRGKRDGADSTPDGKKPRWKDAGKAGVSLRGGAPKVGKANSKKNKARRAAADGPKGGSSAPKRGK